ncbi:MAG: translocation/assembly module TamB domain-containing protein [Pseudomonadota bacterium]
MRLTPTEGRGDRLDVDLSWSPSEPLSGRAELAGEPSGLFATLIRAAPDEAVALTVLAERREESWILSADGKIGGDPAIAMNGARADDRLNLAGSANLALSGFTRSLVERFGEQVDFELSTRPADDGRPFTLSVTAPSVQADASGRLTEDDGARIIEDLDLRLTDMDAARVSSLSSAIMTDAKLRGRFVDGVSGYRFEGIISAPTVSIGPRTVEDMKLDGTFGYDDNIVRIDTVFDASALDGVSGTAGAMLAGALNGRVDGRYRRDRARFDADRFTLESAAARVRGAGSLSSGPVDLAGRLRIKDAANLPATGETRWSLRGNFDGALSGAVSGDLTPDLTDSPLTDLFGETVSVSGDYERTEAGDLRLSEMAIEGDGARISGEASIQGEALGGTIIADLDAGTLEGVSFSALSGVFELGGSVNSPKIDARLQSADVTARGIRISRPVLTGLITLAPTLTGDLRLTGNTYDTPFRIDAFASTGDDGWTVSELNAESRELLVSGELSGTGADVSTLVANLDVAGVTQGGGTLDGGITLGGRQVDAALFGTNVSLPGISARTADLSVSGEWPNYSATLELDGETEVLGLVSDLSLAPRVRLDLSERTAVIRGAASLGGAQLAVVTPVEVAFDTGLVTNGQLSLLEGRVDFDVNWTGEARTSRASFENLSLSRLGPLLGRPSLRGALGGNVSLGSETGQLTGTTEIVLKGLASGRPDSPQADLQLTAGLAGDVLTATLIATDEADALNAQADLTAPVITGINPFQFTFAEGQPATATLSGGGPVAPILALVGPPDMRLEGDVQLDLAASGPVTELVPTGEVTLKNGVFEDGQSGLFLKSVEMTARLDQQAAIVESLSAAGGDGGTLTGSGRYAYDGSGGVELQLNELDALNRRDLTAIMSGAAAMRSVDGRTDITGELTIDQARLNIEELPRGGYTTLDVSFDEAGEEVLPEETEAGAVSLDIGVQADRRVYVVGRGIETEWQIDARLTGHPGAPLINGEANLVRGEADLVSRRFRFSEGSLRFDGPPEDTRIQLRASRTSGGVETIVALTGPALSPDVTLSSNPTLPEDEILSRALFGRSPSQLSPLQAAQLAGAAASLAGGDTFDLTGPLRAATGLDRLDFGIGDAGGATVSTGSYIADDVYLQIETGVSGAPGIALEWTPLSNVEVGTSIDPEFGPRLEVEWTRDFDRLSGEPGE